ncbi:ricin-type beta-trefoil lectin domain protein [Microbacterium pumilum]
MARLLATFVAALSLSVPISAAAATTPDQPPVGIVLGPGGSCLDVAGAETADGTSIQLYECNGTPAQTWQPFADGTLRALGKCLDSGTYGNFGYLVQLRTCDGNRAQRWIGQEDQLATSTGNGCITATTDSELGIRGCVDDETQRFAFPVARGPLVGLGGMCLEVGPPSGADASRVSLHTCTNADAQSWSRPTDGTVRSLDKCLDVVAAGSANGTRVQAYRCNGTAAQLWNLHANGTLLNPSTGKCLDVDGPRGRDGAPLQIWDCFSGADQQWGAAVWSARDGARAPAQWQYGPASFVGALRADRVGVESGQLFIDGATQGTVQGRHGTQISDGALRTSVTSVSATCNAVRLDLGSVTAFGAAGGDATTIPSLTIRLAPDRTEKNASLRYCAIAVALRAGASPQDIARRLNAIL